MSALNRIASLDIGIVNSNFTEPKKIAMEAIENGDECPLVSRIANQEYPKHCDPIRGNSIRNSLINFARVKLRG